MWYVSWEHLFCGFRYQSRSNIVLQLLMTWFKLLPMNQIPQEGHSQRWIVGLWLRSGNKCSVISMEVSWFSSSEEGAAKSQQVQDHINAVWEMQYDRNGRSDGQLVTCSFIMMTSPFKHHKNFAECFEKWERCWENCVRSRGPKAYFEEDWGVIVLCTMFLVSCSVNGFIFHITWLHTFWTYLVHLFYTTDVGWGSIPLK